MTRGRQDAKLSILRRTVDWEFLEPAAAGRNRHPCGASQDPAEKPGVGHLVAGQLGEISGDLDSKSFHERLDRRAIKLSFTSSCDQFRGSLRMLMDNKDEAFDLLRMALTSPRFDAPDVERIGAAALANLRRDSTNPSTLADRKFFEVAFNDHPYGRQGGGTFESVPKIEVADLMDYDLVRCSLSTHPVSMSLKRLREQNQSCTPLSAMPTTSALEPRRCSWVRSASSVGSCREPRWSKRGI
ncbi:hypothetical protein ACVWWO_003423 [Bradyrhizobium sp. F1.13.1]